MTDYPDVPNPDLLERIPLDARVVLDVGCATGALGLEYRRRNPRARLLGIEANRKAAEIAAQRLDLVASVDVEQVPLPFALSAGIDCIIYGDVLEHLKDPWPVLQRHAEALSETGTMLISVPNIEHWSFAARLLAGNWDYEENGLFDRTHLRWFSLDTMRRGLEKIGLIPCDVHPRIFEAERADAFAAVAAPTLKALGVEPENYLLRARPLQYVWRVRRTPPARMMVAGNMLEPVGGVSHTRVVYPLQALTTDPAVQTVVMKDLTLPTVAPGTPRILVLHRPVLSGPNALEMMARVLSAGWLVVTEFDDHPGFFPALKGPGQLAFFGVHAVQTSTRPLAEVLRQLNPEVRVFPNAARALPDPRNFTDPARLTLFFGALNREAAWQPLMETLNSVAAMAGDRLRFSVVHDRQFFDALNTPHKQFTPTCDHETYLRLLGECELCFMPLADTEFDRAKSDLKFVESGACRTAPLASHMVYGDSIEDGRTGLLFHGADDLRARLLRLIAMPELARTLADGARDYVARERMLAYQVADRIGWYRGLWARRSELTAALLARVPNPALEEAAQRGLAI